MDYKRAILQGNTSHHALLKRPNKADKPATATHATPEEQQEIIDELSLLQSRPQLVISRVNTTRVNAIINEHFFRNNRYHTKTEIAISIDSPEARQWLLDRLSSSQQSFQEAVQTLHQFILNNDTDHARTLLEWTALDASGNSCLVRKNNNVPLAHQAINSPEMLEIVLNAGANPDAFDNNRFTPLHRAAMLGNTQSVKVLLTAGAKPTIKTDNPSASSMFDTPLLCAVSLFSKAGHPNRKYDYFKIAGFLVINHFGNGGHAIREQPNRDGLSARTFVAHLRDKSKEGLLLKKFMKEPVIPRKW